MSKLHFMAPVEPVDSAELMATFIRSKRLFDREPTLLDLVAAGFRARDITAHFERAIEIASRA